MSVVSSPSMATNWLDYLRAQLLKHGVTNIEECVEGDPLPVGTPERDAEREHSDEEEPLLTRTLVHSFFNSTRQGNLFFHRNCYGERETARAKGVEIEYMLSCYLHDQTRRHELVYTIRGDTAYPSTASDAPDNPRDRMHTLLALLQSHTRMEEEGLVKPVPAQTLLDRIAEVYGTFVTSR